MDLLKKELERKKKSIELIKTKKKDDEEKRYMKASEIRRIQEEEEEEKERERQQQQRHKKRKKRKLNQQENYYDNDNDNNNRDDEEETENNNTSKKKLKENQQNVESSDTTADKTNIEKDEKTNESSKDQQKTSEEEKVIKIPKKLLQLSSKEITDQLRQLNLPVRLFGEVDDGKKKRDRVKRLHLAIIEQNRITNLAKAENAEMDEFRLGSGYGIRNPFLGSNKKDNYQNDHDDDETNNNTNDGFAAIGGESSKANNKDTSKDQQNNNDNDKSNKGGDNDDDDDNDPHKKIYKFFKSLLKQWEEDLYNRSDSERMSVSGKNETKTLKQCKDYIRPLFKLCKKRTLDESLTNNILKIVNYSQQGEFVKANDAYMDVAIGRAAWPIGVTMVGIHARSGRARIESSNVAHVMNSELQRKYLTSIKRLISYYQKKRTDVLPSKKVT